MTIAERIEKLPPECQTEILDFVGYIEEKNRRLIDEERAELDEIWRRDSEMDEGKVKSLTYDEFLEVIYS